MDKAVETNNAKRVLELLRGNIYTKGDLFIWAAASGHKDVVTHLIEDPVNKASIDDQALCGAIENGHCEIAQLLLDTEEVFVKARHVQVAARNGDVDMVKLLLDDEDVDDKITFSLENFSDDVRTLLQPYVDRDNFLNSCGTGDLEVVEALLPKMNISGECKLALMYAAQFGHIEVVKLLLADKRVDPSANDNCAIYWAAENGYNRVVELLLKDGRVDPSDVIQSCVKRGNIEMLKLLLQNTKVLEFESLIAQSQHEKVTALLQSHREMLICELYQQLGALLGEGKQGTKRKRHE